jgi:hypothetical protein
MKVVIPLAIVSLLSLPTQKCQDKKKDSALYKGKLEIKALCMNYTIRLTEGDIDTSLIASAWTDESTGKFYNKVFGLGNPCDFPSTIQQGDEFYFSIDSVKEKNCAVCMAYYPTPPKKLIIKVVNK